MSAIPKSIIFTPINHQKINPGIRDPQKSPQTDILSTKHENCSPKRPQMTPQDPLESLKNHPRVTLAPINLHIDSPDLQNYSIYLQNAAPQTPKMMPLDT